MVLLESFWDEVLAGPHPDTKPKHLNLKTVNEELGGGGSRSSLSMPGSPTTPATPLSAKKENVWRSVFNPGSNLATKGIGAALFDKPQPNTPTVYDWLYSDDTEASIVDDRSGPVRLLSAREDIYRWLCT